MEKIIVKIRINKKTMQKTVTIPKSAKHLEEGDYVKIEKIEWKNHLNIDFTQSENKSKD